MTSNHRSIPPEEAGHNEHQEQLEIYGYLYASGIALVLFWKVCAPRIGFGREQAQPKLIPANLADFGLLYPQDLSFIFLGETAVEG